MTNEPGRRLRLVRLGVAAGALAVLLALQDDLVRLASSQFRLAGRVGVLVLALVLGMVAIRELVTLVVRRFHGPQAVIWRNLSAWILYALLGLSLAARSWEWWWPPPRRPPWATSSPAWC